MEIIITSLVSIGLTFLVVYLNGYKKRRKIMIDKQEAERQKCYDDPHHFISNYWVVRNMIAKPNFNKEAFNNKFFDLISPSYTQESMAKARINFEMRK